MTGSLILVLLVSCQSEIQNSFVHGLNKTLSTENRSQYSLNFKYFRDDDSVDNRTVLAFYPTFAEVNCTNKEIKLKVNTKRSRFNVLEQLENEEQIYDEDDEEFMEHAIDLVHQLGSGSFDESSGLITIEYKIIENNDFKLLDQANELHDVEKYNEALNVLEELSPEASEQVCILYLKAKIYNELKEYNSSIGYLTQALERSPLNDNLLYSRAHRYNKLGETKLALGDLDASRSINPTHYEIYYLYDKIYSDHDDYRQAIRYSSLGLTYRDDDYFYNLRGWNYYMNDNLELGLLDFEKAIQIEPNNANSYEGIAAIYIEQGHFDEALNLINKSIELDGVNTNRLNQIAYINSEIGKYDKAVISYYKAIDTGQPNSRTYNNLGWIHMEHKRFNEAISVYEKAIDKGFGSELLFNNLGTAYFFKNRFKEAVSYFEITKDYDEGLNTFSYAWLAKSYIKLGNLDEAFKNVKTVITLNPEYSDGLHESWELESTPLDLLLIELENAAITAERTDIVNQLKIIREQL
ncbi:tetratricopeptide repeat protein [Marinicella litoralis]|uniref:Tetratricopeptide repeat protein n=1 Tax=Marinicella litoralis TaxID=644220 RepID=A0A4R6XC19_9GAMM|nr:tetratricopeptide repeat protein [Marinicella litoralis]